MGRKVLGVGGTVVLPAGVLTLRGRDAIEELRSAHSQQARATATLLRRLHVAARVTSEGGMREGPDRFSADEVAAALGWSPAVARRWVEFADDVWLRLPRVLAAMAAGSLDESKARVLSEWTRELSGEHAALVADTLLGHAPKMAAGALIEAVVQTAIALDPEFAARREARARKRARVVGSVTGDGTASLAGYDLPLEDAVEAKARVEALADRVRARGVVLPIGLLRSIVFLRVLGPAGAGLTDAELVEAMVADLRDDGPDEDGPDDDGPDDDGPGDDGPGDDDGSTDDGPTGDGTSAPAPDTDPAAEDPAPQDPAPQDPAPGGAVSGESEEAPSVSDRAPRTRGRRCGVTELRVGLLTLLGLDERPGQLTSWGPLLARRARDWVLTHPQAEWRFVVVDHHGALLQVLLTRYRPAGTRRGRGSGSGSPGVVEVQVPRMVLAGLTPASFPAWAAVLAELQGRLAVLPRDGCPDRRPYATDAAGRRRARAELDRWVRVRDRRCVVAGCRRPARECDLDHTRAWAQDGPSAAWNLGVLCRHHHRMKHVGGWELRQPGPGLFVWRSRAGMTYLVGARPVAEALPGPSLSGGRRRLPPARSCPPERRGFAGAGAGPAVSRTVERDGRLDPTVVFVGTTGTSVTYDDEPPF